MMYRLKEYHRPGTLDEALLLLRREQVRTVALAGGTDLIGAGRGDIEAVVDLANLGLDFIQREGNILRLGATVRLQTIVEELGDVADGLLAETAQRMAGWHIRNMATLGGTLAGDHLHTPLSVALATLGARLAITEHDELLDWPVSGVPSGQLITAVVLDLPAGKMGSAYEQVGRTPADQPIVCAAAAAYRTREGMIASRVAVGGLLRDAVPAVTQTIGGTEAEIEAAAKRATAVSAPESAYLSDALGSAEYRRAVAPKLARRALATAIDRA